VYIWSVDVGVVDVSGAGYFPDSGDEEGELFGGECGGDGGEVDGGGLGNEGCGDVDERAGYGYAGAERGRLGADQKGLSEMMGRLELAQLMIWDKSSVGPNDMGRYISSRLRPLPYIPEGDREKAVH